MPAVLPPTAPPGAIAPRAKPQLSASPLAKKRPEQRERTDAELAHEDRTARVVSAPFFLRLVSRFRNSRKARYRYIANFETTTLGGLHIRQECLHQAAQLIGLLGQRRGRGQL